MTDTKANDGGTNTLITYEAMNPNQASRLTEVDRSEYIDIIYEMNNHQLIEIPSAHDCPTWTDEMMDEIQERFLDEINHGGLAIGAFDEKKLIGFGVLAHKFRGKTSNMLQVDLMYVTRDYRRRGIGTQIMNQLKDEARRRGAEYLYISSTETRSAVSFYTTNGSKLTTEVDEELFRKEPKDIHMVIDL